jgi:hypothetical protein
VRDHDDTLMCDWNQRYSVETVEMSSHQNKLTRRRITPEQAHEEADHTRTSSPGILRIFLRVSTTVSTISPDIGLGRWSCVLDRVTGAKDGGEGSEDGKMRI